MKKRVLYVGLDVHKASISITTCEEGRDGQVSFLGTIPNTPGDIAKLADRLAKKEHGLEFCYEAGGCGYGIHRQLTTMGHCCTVVAPSKIPRAPGERIKTDRRDSQKLAVLHRSGDLTRVWVPDRVHEAMRDLVRVRLDSAKHLTTARQQLLAFLLRHGRSYQTGKNWTIRHRAWLGLQKFDEPAHQIVFQDYVEAVLTATDRQTQLVERITKLLPDWSMGLLVEALRALRGIDLITAVTFVAAVGDLQRFESPRQLMAYLGLVPSEQSSGERVQRGGITKTGNSEVRRTLIESAWSYRFPARVAKDKMDIVARLPKGVRDIAWKAQVRLCARYRRLGAVGKKPTVIVTAIARELTGFIWAIGQEVKPAAS